jgi:hypothetical protein
MHDEDEEEVEELRPEENCVAVESVDDFFNIDAASEEGLGYKESETS